MKTISERIERLTDRTSSCWLWQGYCNKRGHPILRIKYDETHYTTAYVTRLVIGKRLKAREYVFQCCGNIKCLNPAHLYLGGEREKHRLAALKGSYFCPKPHQQGVLHYLAKLDNDKVKYIRKSSKTNQELGKKFGVHAMTIRDVRIGKTWKWLI